MANRNSAFDRHSRMEVAARTDESQDKDSQEKLAAVPPPIPADFNKLLGDSGMDLDDKDDTGNMEAGTTWMGRLGWTGRPQRYG